MFSFKDTFEKVFDYILFSVYSSNVFSIDSFKDSSSVYSSKDSSNVFSSNDLSFMYSYDDSFDDSLNDGLYEYIL